VNIAGFPHPELTAAPRRRPWFRLWPRSLAGRTGLSLILALMVVQGLGLMIHALDRLDLQRIAEARDIGMRAMSIYRAVISTDAGQRGAVLKELELEPKGGFTAVLSDGPPRDDELNPSPLDVQRLVRVSAALVPMPTGRSGRSAPAPSGVRFATSI